MTELVSLRARPGHGPSPRPKDVDPKAQRALASALRERIRGEVRFDDGSRALYATDGSNYRQLPIGVVIPRDVEDVIETVALCREYDAPILSRGGGTSLAGQCCNVAVVIDMSKHLRGILEIDPARRIARVEPGVRCDQLRRAAEEHRLTFGPDPATHKWCTLGGMIGNNSCGVHSQMAGRTSDNVEALEILTYRGARFSVTAAPGAELDRVIGEGGPRGETYGALLSLRDRYADEIRRRFPNIPRRVSGYNLDDLLPERGFQVARALVGTECTCVTVLEATVRLVPARPARTLVVLGYPRIDEAADHVPEAAASGAIGVEGMDREFIADLEKKQIHLDDIGQLPEGRAFLLVEFGADTEQESEAMARAFERSIGRGRHAPEVKVFTGQEDQEAIWRVRDSGLGATAHVPGKKENWEGWEDSAVPPDKVGTYLRKLTKLYAKYGYHGVLYGHFGQGCIHTRIDFDLKSKKGVAKFRSFLEEASDLVLSLGGSLSGEHGDGQSRAELLPKMFGKRIVGAFEEFKRIWDPDGRMNPGKVVHPYRITENLRYGPSYAPPDVATHFQYPRDHHSFAAALERCVGVGECRKNEGTMCPSYMVTAEEMHSTRGRARLLFEMMNGEELPGRKSESVKEALDLCLSCKGCKSECPVQVDMATYKAEFLAHYYEHRRRPRRALAFGLIGRWVRLLKIAPTLANLVARSPIAGRLVRWFAEMTPERPIPRLAPESFRAWFQRRASQAEAAPRPLDQVILFPDTFNNYFTPEVARAAVSVLEDAGFGVELPDRDVCCGRPLYDYGMLDRARAWLERALETLRGPIRSGRPMVVLEPSCAAVFRDELLELLPDDEDAARLAAQTFTLAEFLEKKAPHYRPPRLERSALLHVHCHDKSVLSKDAERSVLEGMQMSVEKLDSGCCGMAGAFGYERDHYQVSMACGERVLLPRVRSAEDDMLIIADGFSCRQQIDQNTRRRPLHLAEAIDLAMRHGPNGPPRGERAELELVRARTQAERRAKIRVVAWSALIAAAAIGGFVRWLRSENA